jgi:hypothetical protein
MVKRRLKSCSKDLFMRIDQRGRQSMIPSIHWVISMSSISNAPAANLGTWRDLRGVLVEIGRSTCLHLCSWCLIPCRDREITTLLYTYGVYVHFQHALKLPDFRTSGHQKSFAALPRNPPGRSDVPMPMRQSPGGRLDLTWVPGQLLCPSCA